MFYKPTPASPVPMPYEPYRLNQVSCELSGLFPSFKNFSLCNTVQTLSNTGYLSVVGQHLFCFPEIANAQHGETNNYNS